MSYDNEAIVRNAYHTAGGTFWTFPDGEAASPRMACWIASFPSFGHGLALRRRC